MRRAAMTLLVMMLTTMTAWADNVNIATAAGFGDITAVNEQSGYYTLASNTYTLTADITTGGYLKVPDGVTAVIDLNGHTIDRGLTTPTARGTVIWVDKNANLTIKDSQGGGTIKGGNTLSYSSAVYVDGESSASYGTLTFEGGIITGNTGNSAVRIGNYAHFTMTGGSITGNEGDGVLVAWLSYFTMTGGSITANSGYGINATSGQLLEFNFSGAPFVTGNAIGNLYLGKNWYFTISGEMATDTNIGITTMDRPTRDTPVTLSTTDANLVTDATAAYFKADIYGYTVYNDGGKLMMRTEFTDQPTFDNGVLTLHGNVDASAVKSYNNKENVTSVVCAPRTVLPDDCSSLFEKFSNVQTIDLSNVDMSHVTKTERMFYSCGNLCKIYVNSDWSMENVTSADNMFISCSHLKGGNGTELGVERDGTYAVIDKTGQAGYLTGVYSLTLPTGMEIVTDADADYKIGSRYLKGASITFRANEGYTVSDVSDGTNTLNANQGIYTVTINEDDVTVTATVKKLMTNDDISATVPNQTLEGPNNPFENIKYKFEYANNNYSESYAQDFITAMGVVVKDGEMVLSLGTDYQFGSVTLADGNPIGEYSTIDDVCKVEIVGKGAYTGSRWATFTIINPPANLGNCWHIPGAQPAGTYMRNPIHPYATLGVSIYTGNQAYGDGGNPGDQSGGTIYYRAAGATAWQTAPMEYNTAIGDNKYWQGTIPADEFAAASTVEYVIKVTYNDDHDDTYLGLAAAGDVASTVFGTLEEAAAHPFDFTYAGEVGQEPAFVWHGGNAVKMSDTSVQLWVKTGYIVGDKAWVDQAQISYAVVIPGQDGTEPDKVIEMRFDHAEEDPSGIGKAMWWTGTVYEPDLAAVGAVLRYKIKARRTGEGGGNGTWRFAEYQADGYANTVFEFAMTKYGADALTVNGQVANYTTSKFFIDESKGESAHLHVVYSPPEGTTDVQVFSNVGRRDLWNADIDNNGVADAIRPPSGDLVTLETTEENKTYYGAWEMKWDADAGAYVWDADVEKTGAYRLTARYKLLNDESWHYYSGGESGIRDHAVVISPKKVLEQNVYELNGMTVKASAANEDGHSTFADLIEGADDYAEFGIPYLNNIGANCLWLQPIHTSSELGLAEGDEPGDPYLTKDLFSVSKWYGKNGTTASALSEFQSFVSACDAGTSPVMRANSIPSKVGTINVMLDATFGHTSIDAVFGEMGKQMGIADATTAIASVKPGWYANCDDYGSPATWYNGPAPGQHDIACAPDRGDIRKWPGTAELFYGDYSALVRHNPDENGNYLNEGDKYEYTSMTSDTEKLWEYMGSYIPYWLDKTGHDFGNDRMGQTDENGTAYDDYGIDGLRCDFAEGLPPQFWEYCINRARAKKWDFMFVAESSGGKVSARNNRQFDVLDDSFASAACNAGSPSELFAVIDDKKASYNGGAVLLNLADHNEPMPYSDPWKTASRYAMLATMKGAPMTFYGQEQGTGSLEWGSGGYNEGAIVQPDAPWTGFTKFELRSGKWIPAYKTWNKLTIWETPPMDEASRKMAKFYGRINRARQNSPALRSDVQYMLDQIEGYPSTDVWAMAKAEEQGALANGKDAVLAFVLFVNDTHYATSQTFRIPEKAANLLGLEAGKIYKARNLASTDPEQVLWAEMTEKLTSEGVKVDFTADQEGRAFYDDGAMVYFLKLEEFEEATDLTLLNDDSSQDADYKNSKLISDAASDSGKKFNVTLQDRTLWKDGFWNTICLPFDVTIEGSALEGATARTVTAASITGTTEKALNLTFGDAVTTLVAGTPYIIKWDKDDENPTINDPEFSGVTIDATDRSFTSGSGATQVRFVGTYKSTSFNSTDNSILLMGVGKDAQDKYVSTLYYPAAGAGVGSCRAYFKIGDDDSQGGPEIKSFVLNFDVEGESEPEVADAIMELKGERVEELKSEGWYDLSGRKLSEKPTVKGMYINNGKKVLIR